MPRTSRVAQQRGMSTRAAQQRKLPGNRYRSKFYVDTHKIPKGMAYAWVRETILGMPDPDNVTDRQVSGWQPVPASRHPELVPPPLPGSEAVTDGIIRRGGLVLMEKPQHMIDEARAEMREENELIVRSIQAFTDHADPLLPKQDYGSSVQIEQVTSMPVRGAQFKD